MIGLGYLFCAAVALLWATALMAQIPGASVQGIVSDTQRRALPGVRVTATQSATASTQHTMTGSKGEYYFSSLPGGVYRREFALEGYQLQAKQGMKLAMTKAKRTQVLSRMAQGGGSNVSQLPLELGPNSGKFFDICYCINPNPPPKLILCACHH
jgi:hypothetical protein